MQEYSLELGPPAKLTTADAVFITDDIEELKRALAMGIKKKLALIACFGPYVVIKPARGPHRIVEWYEDTSEAFLMIEGYVVNVQVNGKLMYRVKTKEPPTVDSICMTGLYSKAKIRVTGDHFTVNYTT